MALAGEHAAHVIAARPRRIEAPPSQQLRPPRHVGVFAVDEEIVVEELAAQNMELTMNPKELEETVKDAIKQAVKNVIKDAMQETQDPTEKEPV